MSASPQFGPRPWQRSASEDLWERTLNQIETRMGRLVYLSRLKNPETDRYEHHGLSAVFGEEAAEEALSRSHMDSLESWLALGVLDQLNDVSRYVEALPQSARRLLLNWERSKGYLLFLPAHASPAQVDLYRANLELIVKHLRSVRRDDGELPNPAT